MIRLLGLALLLVMAAAAPGAAQQVAYAAAVGADLDSATQAAVTREINGARERGLPVEPLTAKVREGRVKHASGSAIRMAVAALAKRLDSARAGLGAGATTDELSAGAEAIGLGASVMELRALRSASPHNIAAPIGTYAQLLASGVERTRALDMIVTLLRRNAPTQQMIALGNLVEADVASGLGADAAAVFRLRSIEGSLGMGDKVTSAVSGADTPHPPSKPSRRP